LCLIMPPVLLVFELNTPKKNITPPRGVLTSSSLVGLCAAAAGWESAQVAKKKRAPAAAAARNI
jgi:hypothetical protein